MKLVYFCLFALPSILFSQDVRDLVRYSQTQVYGNARFEAMGGAFGALGADLSTSSINPAGYARYSKSSAGISFQNVFVTNDALFNSTNTNSSLNLFRLNNLGFVMCNDASENNRGFIFNQFGFSYNRIENFRDKYAYSGQQFYSLLDEFAGLASGMTVDDIYKQLPFTSALAWDTYTIDPDGDNNYVPRLNNSDVIHHRSIDTRGGSSEYNFNLSGNYINKLYIGANIGLRTSKYKEDLVHREIATNSEGISLDSFLYEYHLETKGRGTNLKLGVIYLPVDNFRIGVSLHTPTFFKMKDYFSADMIAYHKDSINTIPEEFKPYGEYKYLLRTPTKLIFSLAYVFSTKGAINVDLDFVNYKWAHFASTDDPNYDPFDYSESNRYAKSQMRPVINLRIGGEYVILSQYFIRVGYAYYPSAYSKANPVSANQIYSCGLGFKWKRNTIDLAYKYESRNFSYFAFEESKTTIKQIRNSVSINYIVTF